MRDLRKYSRQTTFRLVAGFVLILFVVGLGLVYVIYGRDGALFGLICLLAGLSPLVLIWLALLAIEWISRRANPD